MRVLKSGLYAFCMLSFAVVGSAGCVSSINSGQLVAGAMELGKAATANEAELVALSVQMRAQGDASNTVASPSNKYAKRLDRLLKKHQSEGGKTLNYKVYITKDVNANATADGSIRVYSGLMDLMNDNELLYVIGHEIGHVVDGDSLDAVRMAYTTSGLRTTVGSLNSAVGSVTNSELGNLLIASVNAQYSQKQELDADAYALQFMQKYNYPPQAAVSALRKLEKLSSGGGGLLASHPAPGDRATRIENLLASGNSAKNKK